MQPIRSTAFIIATLVASQLISAPARAACPAEPGNDCKFAHSANFSYAKSTDPSKDKLAFKMSKGAYSAVGAFGDPTATTTYDLCIYANYSLVGSMSVGADGDCSDRSCWVLKTKGATFKDKTGTPDGITGIGLATSLEPQDKTKIGVKGKGANLDDMTVPLAEPIIVQLHNSLGNCWGGIFAGEDQVKQDSTKGKAKLKAKVETFPTCSDSIANGWEGDQDCGGPCAPCGYTQGCHSDGDCVSGSCVSGSCAAGCNDSIKNGDEGDTDCGGSCAACGTGKTCNVASDCSSNSCVSGHCAAKRVFTTSTKYNGNLGGLAGADAKCTARAAAAGLGGSWTAWLSTQSSDAIDRIADREYRNRSNQVVFANKAQITGTGTTSADIDDENGNEIFDYAWTGTRNNGLKLASSYYCSDWAVSASGLGGVGKPNLPLNWSAYGSDDCSVSWHLICFEQ